MRAGPIPIPRERARGRALLLVLFGACVASLALGGSAQAFDPGLVAATAGDPSFDPNVTSQFRLNLVNLTACAWPGCNVTRSDEVVVSINGSDRMTGTFVERYVVDVSGVPGFAQNYTTIAVVLKGNTSGVVLQADQSMERATGEVAYTSNLNGSSHSVITLLPSNQTGNITMYVFAYVGDGNRSTHGDREVYHLAVKQIAMRAQRLVPLNVTIANDQNVSVKNVLVSFYARGPSESGYTLVGNTTVAAMNPKGTADVGVAWDATWADPSVYTVKVVIDPLHEHPEVFEDNNVFFFQVNLGTPAAAQQANTVGQLLVGAVVATIAVVCAAIFWYNRAYE
jgi:hypothetical protein